MLFQNKDFRNNKNESYSSLPHLFYLDDVSVMYGTNKALKSIQLTINTGEILFVTGASGAGKTTLLKILGGLVPATQGRVILPQLNSPQLFTSMVFQDLKLLPNLTCEQNLWFAYDSTVYKSKNEFQSELTEYAKLFNMHDHLHLKLGMVNGGMKQKVAIVRALLSRPNIFLADEPTSSLDYENAIKFFDVLNYLNVKRGLTVVWATHNRELVKSFSGRIIHLEGGRLVYSGHACFI